MPIFVLLLRSWFGFPFIVFLVGMSMKCDGPASAPEPSDGPGIQTGTEESSIEKRLRIEDELYREIKAYQYSVQMMPSLSLRKGPGLQYAIIDNVPYGTTLKDVQMKDPIDEVLGQRDMWCQVTIGKPNPASTAENQPAPESNGWMFCSFIGDWDGKSGWVVRDGKAIERFSEAYIEESKLNQCITITPDSIQDFQEGCIGTPCYRCGSIRYRPDGSLAISDIQYPGYCVEKVGGHWVKEKGRIIARFSTADGPQTEPGHIMAGEEKQYREGLRKYHLEEYGIAESDLQFVRSLELDGGQAVLIQDVHDENRKKGFPDFGDEFDRTETPECFYPYSVPLDMLLTRE